MGELDPEPVIDEPNQVLLFGSYTLWRYAEKKGLHPGVFRLRPFVHEEAWQPFMLNGPDVLFLRLDEVPARLPKDERAWFMRPVSDSKEVAGSVKSGLEIHETAARVLKLEEHEIPAGSLRPDTEMMFSYPAKIQSEWRLWIVDDRVVTHSLYVLGSRVVYRPDIDQDALSFAQSLVAANPGYARAYVLDICRTADGLAMLETNCINAAGFYAADLGALVAALEALVFID